MGAFGISNPATGQGPSFATTTNKPSGDGTYTIRGIFLILKLDSGQVLEAVFDHCNVFGDCTDMTDSAQYLNIGGRTYSTRRRL
jgi:hypothetical protein